MIIYSFKIGIRLSVVLDRDEDD